MYSNNILKIVYSFLLITGIGLLSSCVSSVFIGAAPSESEGNPVADQSSTDQPYAAMTSYMVFQEASTQTIYDHRKGFSANQQEYLSDAKAGRYQHPKVNKRINRLEKKAEKRAKQHLKADLKEMRAQAKLDRARREAGIHTVPTFPYYNRHTHGHSCYHKNQ